MNAGDKREFSELLGATLEVYGQRITPTAIAIWWAALASHSIADVRAALSAHVQDATRGKFAPKPADLIAIFEGNDGRPGADAAWAKCPFSEQETAVWTEETAAAFFDAAYALLPDKIAARMAFKDAYEKLVTEARRQRKPVKWTVSLGQDAGAREAVLIEAARLGRVSREYVAGLLPHREIPAPEISALVHQKQIAA